ncbi:MUR3 [Mytilus coruscus]|uniref:MUR3 n=1 Tax=Mytilus coruscus TaxID=42192 RepID=A0A6J8D6E3_MYTCO|nr:MUR3 [Mytilus coruscus]
MIKLVHGVFIFLILNVLSETTTLLDDLYISTNLDDILSKQFKFYIYDLPSSMNVDIVNHAVKNYGLRNCMSLRNNGMGDELLTIGENNEISVRNTDQFALEVIIHQKLLKSSYRTLNPDSADIFYVPAYVGTHCIFYNNYYFTSLSDQLILNLTEFLLSQKYFIEGKPHFSTIGKIHREMCSEFCPYLQYRIAQNMTFLSIEREPIPSNNLFMKTAAQSINVIPYPSFMHWVPGNITNNSLPIPSLDHRDVFIFLPAGIICTNDLRCKIMEQFMHKTNLSYGEYKNQSLPTEMVFFEVSQCDEETEKNLVLWMQRAVFCLQPPGDSPTRKSFYDSIMSGCIPVIFGNHSLQYAFSKYFDFSKFTVSIPVDIAHTDKGVLNFLKDIDIKTLQKLHMNLLNIMKYMQYSISDDKIEEPDDALKFIFAELADKLITKT